MKNTPAPKKPSELIKEEARKVEPSAMHLCKAIMEFLDSHMKPNE